MADFCRQCSLENWGIDDHDYPRDRQPLQPGEGYRQICEGCGFIWVDHEGNCIATGKEGCRKGHGDQ